MRIGVDLGGTKIAAAALAGDGAIAASRRIPAPRGDYQATIGAIRDVVLDIEAELGRKGTVGVGIPGMISPATGLIKNANSVWLIGQPLAGDLAAALARPVRLENDANCFTLSEATDGAAAGAVVVFGVILGTGVGGGLVVDGRLLAGRNAIAGEWGHNPLPWPQTEELPGPRCYCGKQGCLETFLSGPGLERDFAATSGTALAADRIASIADHDQAAKGALARYTDRLARGLASVINIVDPDIVVLGGGISNIAALYADLPALLLRHVFSDRVSTRIVPPLHGDASGVRGAARLWPVGAAP